MNEQENSNQALQVLNQSELCGRQFTVYGTADEPLFLAKDVADMIQVNNHRDLLTRIDEDEKVVGLNDTLGGLQQTTFLTEDGLYEVLMQSRKPIAKEFKKGVKAILKEIRTKGGYIATRPDETDEEFWKRAVLIAQSSLERKDQQLKEANTHIAIAEETIEQQERQLSEAKTQIQIAEGQIEEQAKRIDSLTPLAEYTEQVLQSKSTMTLSQAAMALGLRSVHVLTRFLKLCGVIYKQSKRWLVCSKYREGGYFGTRTHIVHHDNGNDETKKYTVVTEKGLEWISRLIESHRAKGFKIA